MFLSLKAHVAIDFPALTSLVAYLEGKQQKTIDDLTAEVITLTKSLLNSKTELQGSVDNQTQ